MKNKKVTLIIALFVFGVWLLLSTGRLLIYTYKAISDASIWLPLSEEEKKQKLYGNIHAIAKKTEKKIPKDKSILLVTDNGWTFFLLRYLLYPRRVVWIQDQTFNGKIASYDYILTVKSSDTSPVIINNRKK